jgi:putative helicase MOV10L1
MLCPRSRILVATPSNSSADLIAHRLHESGRVGVGELVRLNAFSRNVDTMPETIQPYCMTCDELEKAIRHRILVTTCTTSGKIYTMCLQIGHFTHLFIDEAGQATEPETLVSVGLIRCDSNPGQIILAGDPKQLGPVLMSQHSSSYGLNISLLERLSNNPLYSRNKSFAASGYYNPNLLTKLVRNYRSHPSLLTLPSFMFYENELVSCASVETAEKMAHFSWLPKPGIPLLFHGIRGENYQETDSPSWCNPAEVYHVIRYLQLLLNAKVDPVNVGVITPYRKQVEKIRNFITSNDLFPFKVGSVEEFQGQERDVIIVSTVRSHEYYVDQDVIQHLGFLRSPKRFNVTVTRAKSLLIVIGNPHLLIHDEHWGPFLKHCAQLGAYTGCDLPDL